MLNVNLTLRADPPPYSSLNVNRVFSFLIPYRMTRELTSVFSDCLFKRPFEQSNSHSNPSTQFTLNTKVSVIIRYHLSIHTPLVSTIFRQKRNKFYHFTIATTVYIINYDICTSLYCISCSNISCCFFFSLAFSHFFS